MDNSKDSYHNYVIKHGKLIGDWEGLYNNFEDPWYQSTDANVNDTCRQIAISWCEKLRNLYGSNRVIELGCGSAL